MQRGSQGGVKEGPSLMYTALYLCVIFLSYCSKLAVKWSSHETKINVSSICPRWRSIFKHTFTNCFSFTGNVQIIWPFKGLPYYPSLYFVEICSRQKMGRQFCSLSKLKIKTNIKWKPSSGRHSIIANHRQPQNRSICRMYTIIIDTSHVGLKTDQND